MPAALLTEERVDAKTDAEVRMDAGRVVLVYFTSECLRWI